MNNKNNYDLSYINSFNFYYKFIFAAGVICLAGFINGFILSESEAGKILKLLESYFHLISFTFTGIFLNNLVASLIIFCGGFLLALPSIFSCYINFFILGAACKFYSQKTGLFQFFISTAPHGIFELPAIFIAFVLGLVIASKLFDKMISKDKSNLKTVLIRLTINYIKIVIPLLIIAAFIEVYITPRIIHYFK